MRWPDDMRLAMAGATALRRVGSTGVIDDAGATLLRTSATATTFKGRRPASGSTAAGASNASTTAASTSTMVTDSIGSTGAVGVMAAGSDAMTMSAWGCTAST